MAKSNPMISKRWLINYVLIILICVFTYIGNRYSVQTGYQPDNHISQLKPQDISTIEIKRADQSIHLTKSAGAWQIESPVLWFANNIAVERLISIVNSQIDSKLPSNEIDLSTLGLQFPKAILTLNQTDFVFGDTNNIGERRYLLTDGTVFLLEDRHLPFITQGLTGLVDRRLLPRSLTLKTLKTGHHTFNRDSDNWRSENSQHTVEQITALVDNWQTLEAKHLQSYQAQHTPRQKMTASLDNEGVIEFYLMSITPELVIARPDLGLQYHFTENQYYGLLDLPDAE